MPTPKTAADFITKRRELWTRHRSLEMDARYTATVAAHLLTDEGESVREEIRAEPRLLIEMMFLIVDKDKQTVPFFLNDVQRASSDDLYKAEGDFHAGALLSIRFLILKGRQQGFTAYITAEQLARSLVHKNYSGFTIADCADNTQAIFEDKAKFPYNHLPEQVRPTEKYNNRKELHFEELNSRWRIATASKDIARSKTINFLHISEAAFLPVLISDIQAAVGEALTRDAVQIFESTANGYNEFKDAWDSGKFLNRFYEWWLTREYRVPFESPEREAAFKANVLGKKDWIHQRCRWLVEGVGLDWEQVYWYYNKWDSYIDREKVKQEYPCSSDEAFLSSGRCIFDAETIIQRKEYLKRLYGKEPPGRGYFLFEWNDPDTKDKIKNDTIKFIDSNNGYITIYEGVRAGYPYVIGGDTKGEGSDFFAATVLNNITGRRVAVLHSDLDPDTYAHQTYCLGRYYNDALIGIEINFDLYPVKELQRLKYPKQYVRQLPDDIRDKVQLKYGFKTDGNTRPLIISNEIVLIRDNIELFTHIPMLDECLTFVTDDKGRPDAEKGKHDDILFSDMIAVHIRTQQRMTVTVEKREKKPLPHPLQSPPPRKKRGYVEW
jgi:hypothetical protein